MAGEVRHEQADSRFVIDLGDGEAVLDYRRIDARTLDYRSTRVPEQHRGKGLAGKVVMEALEYARDQGLRVVPSCSYVAAFLERHPEYADLAADRD